MTPLNYQDELDELEKLDDPFDIFSAWYKIASEKEKDPNYMYISTVDEEGRPNIRTVLLKKFGKEGFVFFTSLFFTFFNLRAQKSLFPSSAFKIK